LILVSIYLMLKVFVTIIQHTWDVSCKRPCDRRATQVKQEANDVRGPSHKENIDISPRVHAWAKLSSIQTKRRGWNIVRNRLHDVLAQRRLTAKIQARLVSFKPKIKTILSSCMTVLSVFFLQPMVQGLDCVETADKRRFLDIEPSTECDTSQSVYAVIRRRSIVGILIWLGCAIVLAVAILRGGQSEFAFIAKKMKPNLFWWELFLINRKIAVMTIVTSLSSRKVEAWFWYVQQVAMQKMLTGICTNEH
jgi:hypothetical protein